MNTNLHTRLPWSVDGTDAESTVIFDESGKQICRAVTRADAEHIVGCVYMHDILVVMIGTALNELNYPGSYKKSGAGDLKALLRGVMQQANDLVELDGFFLTKNHGEWLKGKGA